MEVVDFFNKLYNLYNKSGGDIMPNDKARKLANAINDIVTENQLLSENDIELSRGFGSNDLGVYTAAVTKFILPHFSGHFFDLKSEELEEHLINESKKDIATLKNKFVTVLKNTKEEHKYFESLFKAYRDSPNQKKKSKQEKQLLRIIESFQTCTPFGYSVIFLQRNGSFFSDAINSVFKNRGFQYQISWLDNTNCSVDGKYNFKILYLMYFYPEILDQIIGDMVNDIASNPKKLFMTSWCNGNNLLHLLTLTGNIKLYNYFIDKYQLDILYPNDNEQTPLHFLMDCIYCEVYDLLESEKQSKKIDELVRKAESNELLILKSYDIFNFLFDAMAKKNAGDIFQKGLWNEIHLLDFLIYYCLQVLPYLKNNSSAYIKIMDLVVKVHTTFHKHPELHDKVDPNSSSRNYSSREEIEWAAKELEVTNAAAVIDDLSAKLSLKSLKPETNQTIDQIDADDDLTEERIDVETVSVTSEAVTEKEEFSDWEDENLKEDLSNDNNKKDMINMMLPPFDNDTSDGAYLGDFLEEEGEPDVPNVPNVEKWVSEYNPMQDGNDSKQGSGNIEAFLKGRQKGMQLLVAKQEDLPDLIDDSSENTETKNTKTSTEVFQPLTTWMHSPLNSSEPDMIQINQQLIEQRRKQQEASKQSYNHIKDIDPETTKDLDSLTAFLKTLAPPSCRM